MIFCARWKAIGPICRRESSKKTGYGADIPSYIRFSTRKRRGFLKEFKLKNGETVVLRPPFAQNAQTTFELLRKPVSLLGAVEFTMMVEEERTFQEQVLADLDCACFCRFIVVGQNCVGLVQGGRKRMPQGFRRPGFLPRPLQLGLLLSEEDAFDIR